MDPRLLRDLFSELATEAAESSAPSLASVLELARRERTRRLRRRAWAVAGIFCGASLLWMRTENVPAQPTQARAAQVEAAAPAGEDFPIEHVSDAELLDLLGRTPAALVELPDGRQRLMVWIANDPSR